MIVISNTPDASAGLMPYSPRRFNITVAPVTATYEPFATGINTHAGAQKSAWEALANRIPGSLQEKILFQLFREPEHRLPVEGMHDLLLYKMKLCRVLNQFNIADQFRYLFPDPELNLCNVNTLEIIGPDTLPYEPGLALFMDFGVPSYDAGGGGGGPV